jgi:hypothetical protein
MSDVRGHILLTDLTSRGPSFGLPRRCIGALLVGSMLVGCQTYAILTFEPDEERSGIVENQEVRAIYYRGGPDENPVEKLDLAGVASDSLKTALERCIPKPDEAGFLPALAIPLVAAAAQFVFTIGTDALAARLNEIRDRAQRTYTSRVTVEFEEPTQLLAYEVTNPECILFLRETRSDDNGDTALGLAVLFEKRRRGDGLILVPSYVELRNAMAETSASAGTISVALAIVVKVLVNEPLHSDPSLSKLVLHTLVDETFKFSSVKFDDPIIGCEVETDPITERPDYDTEVCKPEGRNIRPERQAIFG